MAMSLDGKVVSPGGTIPTFTSRRDRELLFELRAKSDVILVGAGTIRAEGLQPLVRSAKWRSWRQENRGTEHPDVAIVSASGNLDLKGPYFHEQQNFHIFSTKKEPEHTPSWIAWHESATLTMSPSSIKHSLEECGYNRILLEGGPILAHSFFQANCVDEIYLTLSAKILGGEQGNGIAKGVPLLLPLDFEVKDVQHTENEVFIRLLRN